MSNPIRRRLGRIKWRLQEAGRTTSYRVPLPWSRHLIRRFWDSQVAYYDARWGDSVHDYEVVGKLLETYQPSSILDVGCGPGRLFGLFKQYQIICEAQFDIVGVDVSSEALSLASQRFPDVPTLLCSLEDISFPADRFDFAVCNRVLQHVPSHAIASVIAKLCTICKAVYIKEISDSDGEPENFYMVRHDYSSMFADQQFKCLVEGHISDQTYWLYWRSKPEPEYAELNVKLT